MKCYGIKLKSSLSIRYVGQTAGSLEDRFTRHLRSKLRIPIAQWISKHRDDVEIVWLHDAKSLDDLNNLEIFLIEAYRSIGQADLNVCNGGSAPRGDHVISAIISAVNRPEVKEKIRATNARQDVKKRRSDAVKRSTSRPLVRERISGSVRDPK